MLSNIFDWVSQRKLMTGMGALLAGAGVVAISNYNDMQKTIAKMDQQPTVVFNSFADCQRQGFDAANCAVSQQKAANIAEGLGTKLTYYTLSQCTIRHGSCVPHVDTDTSCDTDGNNCTTTTTTTYNPPVVGWIALADDISKSLPLYSSASSGLGVRYDGREYSFGVR